MNKKTIVIAIFLVVLVAAVVAWVVFSKGKEIQTQTQTNPAKTNNQASGIGGEIFQKIQNPVAGKLPESNVGGNVNPLSGAYKNPFGQ